MFDTDSQLSQWTQGFAEQAERFHAMRVKVEQVQVTESSRDGAVRVTVDSSGVLTELAFTDKISDLTPPELAAQVMACLRRAQQQLAPRVQQAMQATVGGTQPVVDQVVSGYRARFGDDLSQHSAQPHTGVLGMGVIEDDYPSPQYPRNYSPPSRRQTRAVPPGDEEYFADRGYLS